MKPVTCHSQSFHQRISAPHSVLTRAAADLEALQTHGIWANPSKEELAAIKDGPAAEHFWTQTGISRIEMVHYLHAEVKHLGPDSQIISVEHKRTKKTKAYSLRDLGLTLDVLTEATAQFWSCAQARIMLVFNNVARTAHNPVPDYLLPNADIKKLIAEAWASS